MSTEEINIVKQAPLIRPCKLSIRPVHSLQPILSLVAAKLIVIRQTPRQSPNDTNAILMDSLQSLCKKVPIVKRTLRIIPLRIEGPI